MADKQYEGRNDVGANPENYVVVTPSNTVDLPQALRGIMVDAAGDVYVDAVGVGENIRMPNLAAGVWHPARVTRIYSTGTAPAYILGGY